MQGPNKPRLRRAIIAAVLTLLFAEPLVMYLSLQHERAQRVETRHEAAELLAGGAGR